MAKIKLNPLYAGISGTLGDIVFKQSRNGEIIIAQRPKKSNIPPSAAQLANRERLKLANAYAKAALADPDVRAVYEQLAEQEGKGVYAAARDDFFKGHDLLSKE